MKVAEFISYHLRASGKTHAEIAHEIGLTNPNFISMIKKGTAKIPLGRIAELAASLKISPQSLLFRCLEEYDPALLRTIHLTLPGAFLSDEELEMVNVVKSKVALLTLPKRTKR